MTARLSCFVLAFVRVEVGTFYFCGRLAIPPGLRTVRPGFLAPFPGSKLLHSCRHQTKTKPAPRRPGTQPWGPAKTKHRPRTRGVATGIISSVTVTCQSSFGTLARPSHTHTLTLFLFAQDLLLLALFIFFLLTIAKFSFCLSQSHSSPSAGPFLPFLLSTSRAGLDLRPSSFCLARQSRH